MGDEGHCLTLQPLPGRWASVQVACMYAKGAWSLKRPKAQVSFLACKVVVYSACVEYTPLVATICF